MGEKIGMFIYLMVIFFSSLINAFVHGWELTLVILSVFPALALSTGIMAKVFIKLLLFIIYVNLIYVYNIAIPP